MMDMTTFRPMDGTAAAISDALAKAQLALAEQTATVAAAKDTRDGLLLDGDTDELLRAEKALADARGSDERLVAIVKTLDARLGKATRTEAIQAVKDASSAYSTADAARAAWWRKEGPKLRRILAEGYRLDSAVKSAAGDFQRYGNRLQQNYPDEPGQPVDFDMTSNADVYAEKVLIWTEGEQLDGGVE